MKVSPSNGGQDAKQAFECLRDVHETAFETRFQHVTDANIGEVFNAQNEWALAREAIVGGERLSLCRKDPRLRDLAYPRLQLEAVRGVEEKLDANAAKPRPRLTPKEHEIIKNDLYGVFKIAKVDIAVRSSAKAALLLGILHCTS